MPGSLNNALLFLINSIFDLYLFILAVRLILAWSRADYFNPITRVVIQVTQPVIAPLRRVIPNYARIEFSTLVFMIFLEIVKISVISLLVMGGAPVVAVIITALVEFTRLILNTFFYAILVHVIMSWVSPGYSPLGQVLTQLSSPILRPCQRLIPPLGGLDLSPVIAMLGLQFVMILLR
jgi:YggT family protein